MKGQAGIKNRAEIWFFLASVQLLPAPRISFSSLSFSFHTYNGLPWVIQGVNTKQPSTSLTTGECRMCFCVYVCVSVSACKDGCGCSCTLAGQKCRKWIKCTQQYPCWSKCLLLFDTMSRAFEVNSRRQEKTTKDESREWVSREVTWPTLSLSLSLSLSLLVTGNISNCSSNFAHQTWAQITSLQNVSVKCVGEKGRRWRRRRDEREERKERKKERPSKIPSADRKQADLQQGSSQNRDRNIFQHPPHRELHFVARPVVPPAKSVSPKFTHSQLHLHAYSIIWHSGVKEEWERKRESKLTQESPLRRIKEQMPHAGWVWA